MLAVVGLVAPNAVASGTQARPGATAKPTGLAAARVKLKQVATGLDSPTVIGFRAGKLNPMYVAQQSGTIVTIGTNGRISGTVLRLTKLAQGDEEGLLGFAFSKDGTKLYVDYTDATCRSLTFAAASLAGDVSCGATDASARGAIVTEPAINAIASVAPSLRTSGA